MHTDNLRTHLANMETLQFAVHVSVLLFLVYFFAKALNSPNPTQELAAFVITTSAGFVLGWAVKTYQKDEGNRGLITKKDEEALNLTTDLAVV